MSQASSILALAGLATTAGAGQAFNNRFAQEQQLLGNLIRQRQIGLQEFRARQDAQLRRDALNQETAFRSFSAALENEQRNRELAQKAKNQELASRQEQINQTLREREIQRREADLGLRQQEFAFQSGPEAQRLNLERERKAQRQRLAEINSISELLDNPAIELSDQDIQGLQQTRQALLRQIIQSEKQTNAAQLQQAENLDIKQRTEPVSKTDAGPMLRKALQAARQSSVLTLPVDPADPSVVDTDNLKRGAVYFIPQRGPAVWTGKTFIPISEKIPDTVPGNNTSRLLSSLLLSGV